MASVNVESVDSTFNKKSSVRDPLNVVVEKVGATRATVRGDVSTESLKELLMSSLSVLPKTTTDEQWNNNNERVQTGITEDSDTENGLEYHKKHSKNDPGTISAKDSGVGKEKSTESPKVVKRTENIKKAHHIPGSEISKFKDAEGGKNSSTRHGIRSTGTNLPKNKLVARRKKRNFENKGIRRYKLEKNDEQIGEGEADSSLSSSLSTVFCSSIKEPTFSGDSHWLQINFGRSLVQGLRNIAERKPQDPVNYLAFFLRHWRSEEEVRRRKKDLENDLQTQRLTLKNNLPKLEDLTDTFEPESMYGEDQEEEGGQGDSNFQDYYRY